MKNLISGIIFIVLFTGCETVKQSSKFGLKEGYYTSRLYHKKSKKIYLVPNDDSIKVYTVKKPEEDPQTVFNL